MTTDRQLAANIRRAMHQEGMTSRGLALTIGTTESVVSKILNGHRTLKATELERIARALNITTDALLSGGT